MEKQTFDFEAFKKEAASQLKKGETLLGRDGVFTPLLKEFWKKLWRANWKPILNKPRNRIERTDGAENG